MLYQMTGGQCSCLAPIHGVLVRQQVLTRLLRSLRETCGRRVAASRGRGPPQRPPVPAYALANLDVSALERLVAGVVTVPDEYSVLVRAGLTPRLAHVGDADAE